LNEAILRVRTDHGQLVWRRFNRPVQTFSAERLDEVVSKLAEVDAAAQGGLACVGFIAYEAAAAFDPSLTTHPPRSVLLRFTAFESWEDFDELPLPTTSSVEDMGWDPELDDHAYASAVERVRELIAAGDTYQVNLTLRLRSRALASPAALFRQMAHCPKTAYSAYLSDDNYALCCASPELFFELNDDIVRSSPMKGTAPRGRTTSEDTKLAGELAQSEKNRAENLMILDMVRNDLGRIAETGTVRVEDLFKVERYETVHQMISTVSARTSEPLVDIFRALFPAASMTGAPKRRTMEIIRDLEASPRGAYAGCIGVVGPGRHARFGVAIRTAVLDRHRGEWEYGVGGGIVWDSSPADEHAEWVTKTAVLRPPPPEFSLLETFRFTPERGYWLFDRHLERLIDSAAYFDRPIDVFEVVRALHDTAIASPEPKRVRLLVDPSGGATAMASPLEEWPAEPHVAIANQPVDPADRMLFHKTTHRSLYNQARADHPGCDEVLLWNTRGEITEGTFSNVMFRLEGKLYTPPLDCGLLPGVLRAKLIEEGNLLERVLTVEELGSVEAIYLLNSVRGISAPVRLHLPESNVHNRKT
jgi:para-aminobenzoate synthetase/4-amino-4-deoxychorismate lyase